MHNTWEQVPKIYSALARDVNMIPALFTGKSSCRVRYLVLLILLNETESISYLKRLMGLWVWGERREGAALFLASVKIPGRPQHSVSPFCSDGEVVWEKLKAKVKRMHMYESIKTDGLSLTRNLQQTSAW